VAGRQVFVVQRPDPVEMGSQRLRQGLRKHGHAVLEALSVTHHDLAALEVQVFDAQTQTLRDAQPCAVQQAGNQPRGPSHPAEQQSHLGLGEDHGQALRRLGGYHAVQPGKLDAEHFPVEEQERTFCLILRGSGHVALDGKVGQESLHLLLPQIARVPLPMEQDESSYPVDIRQFGTDTIVLRPQPAPQVVQEPGRRG
jgi:hypothetical protein